VGIREQTGQDIRKVFVEKDWVEAVLLLPENMFYNTTAPGIILVINKDKKKKGEIILINASKLFTKGRPKNYLPDENIQKIHKIYLKWKEEKGISKVIKNEEAIKNDFNLSPSRYVSQDGGEEVLPIEEAVILLKEAEEERLSADIRLVRIFKEMGLY
jgi:type I restriction enzyme M protein